MSNREGRVAQINVSQGGVPKLAVLTAWVASSGVENDVQNDRRHHGGRDRAVSLYSADLIASLAAAGHPIAPGTVGENLTVEGLDWTLVRPGAVLEVGDAELVVTDYASPCQTIRGSFADENSNRINQQKWPGWSRVYARVLREGIVRTGDVVRVR